MYTAHAICLVSMAACASFGSAHAQSFPLSVGAFARTGIHGDSTGLYFVTQVRAPGDGPYSTIQALHFDGRAFSSLGTETFGTGKVQPAAGFSVTRTASGDVLLKGKHEFEQWLEPCLMRRRGTQWEVVERDNANAFDVVAVGDRVLCRNHMGGPKSMRDSKSGLYELRADGAWGDLGVIKVGPGDRKQPGTVYDIAVAGSKAYIIGSFDRAADTACRDLVCFDGATGAWTSIPPPYPAPQPNALGAPGEPRGTLDEIAATEDGRIFVLGRLRDKFGYDDLALSVYENGAWRALGKVERSSELLPDVVLVASGNDVFGIGTFETLIGEPCDGFARWNGTKFVAAGKRKGIWSYPDGPDGGEATRWNVGLRQGLCATGGWPGRIAVLRKSDPQRDPSQSFSELAVFDIAAGDWIHAKGTLSVGK